MVSPEPATSEPSQQPRSPIALDKLPVKGNTCSETIATAIDLNSHENAGQSARSIGDTQALRYSPLSLPNIRLVTISSSLRDGTIELFLSEAPLNEELEFHVLSYVWGDAANKRTVIINDQKLDITVNLYDFLETTRTQEGSFLAHHAHSDYLQSYTSGSEHTTGSSEESQSTDLVNVPVYWWIDAICINQDDIDEKNKQVPRMGDIYSMASRVWVWAGMPSSVFTTTPVDLDFPELKKALAMNTQDSIIFKNMGAQEKQSPTPLIDQFGNYQRQMFIQRSIARDSAMGMDLPPNMDAMFGLRYDKIIDEVDPEVKYGLYNQFLRQLADLLNQPYFVRTWTIQEYILNSRPPVALVGGFVFDLDHVHSLATRLVSESDSMHPLMQAHSTAVWGRALNLFQISIARDRWHNLPRTTVVNIGSGGSASQILSVPDESFSLLPPGEKLSYLLQGFIKRECTNPLDRFYGLLGLLDIHEIPKSLLPDYNLSLPQVSRDYIRYIIESTRNLTMMESASGHTAVDCPSWVPNVKHLHPARPGYSVSRDNKSFSFSEDGRFLTVEGIKVGEIITCSCTACPTEYKEKHFDFIHDVLIEGAAEITGQSMTEIFQSWLKAELSLRQIPPTSVPNIKSMHDLIESYHEICKDIPQQVLAAFDGVPLENMYSLFSTICRDPKLLYTLLSLGRLRYCLLSTGDIVSCGLKNTNATPESPTHSWDDCAWALKGLQQLAILRPKGEGFEYCGLLMETNSMLPASRAEGRQKFRLDDEFFAGRDTQQVMLV